MIGKRSAALGVFATCWFGLTATSGAVCLDARFNTEVHIVQKYAVGKYSTMTPGAITPQNGTTKTGQVSVSYCFAGSEAWLVDEAEATRLPHVPLGKSITYTVSTSGGPATATDLARSDGVKYSFSRKFIVKSDQYQGTYTQTSKTLSIQFDGASCRVLDYRANTVMAIRVGQGNFTGINAFGRGGECNVSQ